MTPVKPPPPALRAHAARDFRRGFETKNLVKGAGGGARGVDFMDTEADFAERSMKAGVDGDRQGEDRARDSVVDAKDAQAHAERNAADIVLADLVQQQERVNAPIQALDEDEERKKKKSQQQPDKEQPEQQEEAVSTVAPDTDVCVAPSNAAHEQFLLSSISKLLQDPEAEYRVFGALVLQDPEQMRKTLGTPIRVAKHLLVIARRLMEQGQERTQVVDYVANTFVALGQEFGGRAFKDYLFNIGIGALYPLEVLEKIILVDDKFLPNTMKCRFTSGKRLLVGKTREPIIIEYPEDLTVTGFGVKGGTKAGYQLVPMKEKGKHGLILFQPGEYRVLLCGVDTMGFERVEEIRVQVSGEAVTIDTPVTAKRTSSVASLRAAPNAAAAGRAPSIASFVTLNSSPKKPAQARPTPLATPAAFSTSRPVTPAVSLSRPMASPYSTSTPATPATSPYSTSTPATPAASPSAATTPAPAPSPWSTSTPAAPAAAPSPWSTSMPAAPAAAPSPWSTTTPAVPAAAPSPWSTSTPAPSSTGPESVEPPASPNSTTTPAQSAPDAMPLPAEAPAPRKPDLLRRIRRHTRPVMEPPPESVTPPEGGEMSTAETEGGGDTIPEEGDTGASET